ncbi:hypothetical protein MMC28_008573 [Mycoblastus sanguinarius]|nr:hypothetical protein [Mycoblastus sanguinarius]
MSDEGATPRELLLESSRRNNTSLLTDLLSSLSSPEKIAHLLNTATDGVGNYCLHVAASYGSYVQDGVEREWAWANRWCGADEVLDTLLDQEGLEVDPVDRLEKDTPLHKAVRFINGLAKKEWEAGSSIVELLLDAGADPRIRNKAKLKPFELVDPRNTELRTVLQKAEFATMAGGDVVDADGEEEGPTGSASDSE